MKIVKIALLTAIAFLIYRESNSELWQNIADENWVRSYLISHGISGTMALLLFGAVFTGCGGPRQLIAFTFGFAFGSVWGTVLCILSTLGGALCSYSVAHFTLKPTLTRKFGRRVEQFRQFVGSAPFSKILIIRLFPVGNNLITNLLSGIASVPLKAFIAASLIGYLPQTLIFALAGSGVGSANEWQLIISIALGIISMVLTGHLYQKYRKSHTRTTI
ncbi:VTT domain-containing protein [Vibrio fluvialis]|nr:VTT domain-containing protein [Vibrio fluvialis]